MHLSLLPPISNSQVYVKGDVSIHETASIAPGAIVQADPGSKIIIAAGVCIGMGVILHAHKGNIEVETGAILGAGVLVVGTAKIGANACLGAATTIWNSSVERSQILPAGSLIGDKGRSAPVTEEKEEVPTTEEENKEVAAAEEEKVATIQEATNNNGFSPTSSTKETAPQTAELATVTETPPPQVSSDSSPGGIAVYGQASLNRLLGTLFPYKAKAEQEGEEEQGGQEG